MCFKELKREENTTKDYLLDTYGLIATPPANNMYPILDIGAYVTKPLSTASW